MATSVAAYFGLIESVGGNVKKLLHGPFNSAINNLKSALCATDENVEFYIRQALIEFNNACSLESNENLISAHIGKAMCQHLLRDYLNRDLTMENIKTIELSLSEKTKAVSKTALKFTGPGQLYCMYKLFRGRPETLSDYQEREKSFNEYKQLALATK